MKMDNDSTTPHSCEYRYNFKIKDRSGGYGPNGVRKCLKGRSDRIYQGKREKNISLWELLSWSKHSIWTDIASLNQL